MQACVEGGVGPRRVHYNSVGYIALGAAGAGARPHRDVRAPGADRVPLGAIAGEAEVDAHMKALFPRLARAGCDDLPARAPGRLRVQRRVRARPTRQVPRRGCSVLEDVEVTGFAHGRRHRLDCRDERGGIEIGEQVVIAPGPWAARFWSLLDMPDRIDITTPSGEVVRDRPMWTYWNLQEGEITVDPLMFATADGGRAAGDRPRHHAPPAPDDGDLSPTRSCGRSTSNATATASRAARRR